MRLVLIFIGLALMIGCQTQQVTSRLSTENNTQKDNPIQPDKTVWINAKLAAKENKDANAEIARICVGSYRIVSVLKNGPTSLI